MDYCYHDYVVESPTWQTTPLATPTWTLNICHYPLSVCIINLLFLFSEFHALQLTCITITSLYPAPAQWVYYMWPSTGKPGTTRHPLKIFFCTYRVVGVQILTSPSFIVIASRSHYNRPNRSLLSAWNNKFLRNQFIFSRYLRTPRCTRCSCRRSHILACWTCAPFSVSSWVLQLHLTLVNLLFGLKQQQLVS